jgi:hypothetical protein
MANHIKQQLREAAAAAVGNLTTTAGRVFQSRVYPLQGNEVPGLCVYTRRSDNEPLTLKRPGGRLARQIELAIEIHVKKVSNPDDELDLIQKEVEVAMSADITFGGIAKDSYLDSEDDEEDGDGERPTWQRTLVYLCMVHTADNVPDVALA